MRETRLYGSQGGGAGRSPYPYHLKRFATKTRLAALKAATTWLDFPSCSVRSQNELS
jgi:hypothetical protein